MQLMDIPQMRSVQLNIPSCHLFQKNLFEQFRRYPNWYFLAVCIPTLIPTVSPITPASAIVPFLLILFVSAAKEAYEDIKRYQSDNEFNNRKYEVFRDGLWVNVANQSILAGDLIVLKEEQEVPADVVLCSTTNHDGICYFETANLDGETYLKQAKSVGHTREYDRTRLAGMSAFLNVEPPHKDLYELKGTMTIAPTGAVLNNPLSGGGSVPGETVHSLDDRHLLMRGVKIKNTKEALGVVTYTGKNTKLALNQVETPSKFSRTERFTNWITIAIFIIKMILVISCTIAAALETADGVGMWYVETNSEVSREAGITFAAYFVLFSNFIPISLFVNLEVIKLAQAAFMMADDQMKVNGEGMTVRNSNLNDELSRVGFIFSDKTGTLTQNKMVFESCSIAGINYKTAGQGGAAKKVPKDPLCTDFFLNLALNNEALPENKGDEMPHFAAPSPDEIALVKGAWLNGVRMVSRDTKGLVIQIADGQPQLYQVLDILPFSSERKRSSVVVLCPNGRYVLFTKGADTVIFERLNQRVHDSPLLKDTKKHMTTYSGKGLRTLLIAKRELTQQEYEAFHYEYQQASLAIDKRKEITAAVMDRFEQGLEMQGCTAIEDKLQEAVPWTINYFIKCGIKVWMITGDKLETAENIGKSCNLITEDSAIIKIVDASSTQDCQNMIDTARRVLQSEKKVALVVDSKSLGFLFVDHKDAFVEVSLGCSSVIVCRAEPLQKAQVVSLIKKGTDEICLAIGDGANDVSMIQEAHIGVGLHGEEGSQAARSSDYALRQFKHLGRLIAIHGRYNMMRTALMIEFSFYKNLAMFIVQFWFAFYCHFSAQTFYDSWVMAGFNTVLVSAPPLVLALFEKDLREHIILQHPDAFPELKRGLYLTKKSFSRWMISAIYHSIVFWFGIYLLPAALHVIGTNAGLFELSTFVATAGITTIILKAALVTRYWVWVSHLAYWGSLFLLFVLFLIESAWIEAFPTFYRTMNFVLTSPSIYFYVPCIVMICLVPDFAFEYIQSQWFPERWQTIREQTIHSREEETDAHGFVELQLGQGNDYPDIELENNHSRQLQPNHSQNIQDSQNIDLNSDSSSENTIY